MRNILRTLFLFISFIALTSCGAGLATSNQDSIDTYLFRSKSAQKRYYAAYDRTLELYDVPYKQYGVATRFGSAHVIVTGPEDGPPLLLVHGMDASSTMWYPNIKSFSQTHRVYAVDYIMDAGKSVLLSGPLDKRDIVLFYEDVLNHFDISKTDVIGVSRGGWIATQLALKRPDRINKIVLLSPAQVFCMVGFDIMPAIRFKLFPTHDNLERTFKVLAKYPGRIEPIYKQQFLVANKYAKSKAQLTRMMPFWKSELKRVHHPVLLLVGEHDVLNPPRAILKAQKSLPNLTVDVVPDAGHFTSTDQIPYVNESIARFLADSANAAANF